MCYHTRMDQVSLDVRLEALLFAEGGGITKKKLAAQLGCSPEELAQASVTLRARLTGGISLIESDTECALAIAAAAADTVRAAQEAELGKEIGDAGLEVLSIILYRGPSTRAEVDYIRGVNTSSTIRNLLMRGLLERAGNPADGREYLYRPTVELLAHLGVREGQELPDYARIKAELEAFANRSAPAHDDGTSTASEHDARTS